MSIASAAAISPRPSTATLVLLASLYCAQGLPSGLIAHALPVLLRQHGVDLAVISLLKLLALPWLLKALWAPWVDRLSLFGGRLGHHRGWILPLQAATIAIVAVLASPALTRAPREIWRRIGLDGAPTDGSLASTTGWGGYPGGLAVEKGDPLFPRLTAAS